MKSRLKAKVKNIYRSHFAWFFIAILMVPLFLWFSHSATNQLVQAKALLEHSYNVLFRCEQLRSGVELLETARRGYVLTSEEQYLEPYHYAKKQIPEDIKALNELTADNLIMQQNMQAIEPVVDSLLDLVTRDIRNPAKDSGLVTETMHQAKALLDQARYLLTEMEKEERRLLEIRISDTETRQQELNYKMSLMGVSFLLVLIYTFMKLFAEVAERKRSEAGLIETKAQNEVTVHNLSLMGELSSLLQACSKTEESLEVISQFAARMINVDSGELYLFKESSNLLEESTKWGVVSKSQPSFEPDDCWALRRGEMHVLDQLEHTMSCRHVEADPGVRTLCVPIVAQGTVLGILHLENHHHQPITELQQTLAHNLASQVALALASLNLRETLRNLSVRDPLTGLFNRRYMEESLHREIATARRKNRHLAVVMLDVDYFKKFNDTFGHDAGDMLLREVGGLLQANSRISDIACRFGGEEFVMIYPETEPNVVMQRTELLREAIAAMQLQHFSRSLGQITASFGIAIFPNHGSTIEELLKSADEALYRAKGEGRNLCIMAE